MIYEMIESCAKKTVKNYYLDVLSTFVKCKKK